ncbi:MAG: hypothetical protein ACE5I7_12940 [Candidatus Binatia bacterium]
MARIIDFQRFKLQRAASRGKSEETMLPWSWDAWFACRLRHFVRTVPAARPPRCCCGRVYNQFTLHTRAAALEAIVRETREELERTGRATVPYLLAAVLAHPDLTSVEKAALSTGPCAACSVLAEQTQQLRFLWSLQRAYWKRATSSPVPRSHQGELLAQESRQCANDLRKHIRHEIGLIRHIQHQLALCPWARQRSHAARPSLGC